MFSKKLGLGLSDYCSTSPMIDKTSNRNRSTGRIFSAPMVFGIGVLLSTLILQEVDGFSCQGRPNGYYADVQMGCEIYHMCDGLGRMFTYSCPNTTLFQQRMLICDHWYMVNCSLSENDYSANLLIGQRNKPFVDDSVEHPYQRTPRPDLGSFQKLHQYHHNYELYTRNQNLVGGSEEDTDGQEFIKTTPRSAIHSWSTEYSTASKEKQSFSTNTEIPLQFASTRNVIRSSSTPPPNFRQHEPPARAVSLKRAEPTPRSLPESSFGSRGFESTGNRIDSAENTVHIPPKVQNQFTQTTKNTFTQRNTQKTQRTYKQTTKPVVQTTPKPFTTAFSAPSAPTGTSATGFSSSGSSLAPFPISRGSDYPTTTGLDIQNVQVPNTELEPPFLEPKSERRQDFLRTNFESSSSSKELDNEEQLVLNVSPPSIYYQPPKLEVYKGFEETTMDPITFAKIVPVKPYNPNQLLEKTTGGGVVSANHVRSLDKDSGNSGNHPRGVTISTNEGGDVTVTAASNRQDNRENVPVKEEDEKKWKLLKKLFFIPDYVFPLDTVTRPSYDSGISSY